MTLEQTATGVALILVDAKAENQIAVAPGANAGLTAMHVRQALGRLAPHQGDVVIVTHEIPTAAAREALRIGRLGGAWTVLNPAPADGLDRSVLSLADVLTPNRGELASSRRGRRPAFRPHDDRRGGTDPRGPHAARGHQRGPRRRRRPSSCRWGPAGRCSSGGKGHRSTSGRRR